jgi:hypothetical protein
MLLRHWLLPVQVQAGSLLQQGVPGGSMATAQASVQGPAAAAAADRSCKLMELLWWALQYLPAITGNDALTVPSWLVAHCLQICEAIAAQ